MKYIKIGLLLVSLMVAPVAAFGYYGNYDPCTGCSFSSCPCRGCGWGSFSLFDW